MVSSAKIVQVPIDEELLASLDELSRGRRTSRSAVIRDACREYLRRLREEALDEVYERGYRRTPEGTATGETQASLAAQVLPEESW